MAGQPPSDDQVNLETHVRGDDVIHERYEHQLADGASQLFAATDSHLLSVKWEEGTDTERTRRIPFDEIDSVEPRPVERGDGRFARFVAGTLLSLVGLVGLYVAVSNPLLLTSVVAFAVGGGVLLAGGYLVWQSRQSSPSEGYAVHLDVPGSEAETSIELPAAAESLVEEVRQHTD